MDTGYDDQNGKAEAAEAYDAGTQAYIKRVRTDGAVGYGIHAADGTVLGVAPTRELAFLVARRHDLEPVSVH